MSSVAEVTSAASATNEAEVASLPFVKVDEARIQEHLDDVVRRTVEETLNALLDAELCGAKRYERSGTRRDTRAGHYSRHLHTKAGEVELKVPKLRSLPFESAVIERYRRRVEDSTEALWGTRVSSSTVSELNKKIYTQIHEWRNRPIEGEHAYVYLDG